MYGMYEKSLLVEGVVHIPDACSVRLQEPAQAGRKGGGVSPLGRPIKRFWRNLATLARRRLLLALSSCAGLVGVCFIFRIFFL